jgi:hypothetical protein
MDKNSPHSEPESMLSSSSNSAPGVGDAIGSPANSNARVRYVDGRMLNGCLSFKKSQKEKTKMKKEKRNRMRNLFHMQKVHAEHLEPHVDCWTPC